MTSANPLLYKLSNLPEIKQFCDSLEKNVSSSLLFTSDVARSYFIGAISLNRKVVVICDESFSLYHESVDVESFKSQYLPHDFKSEIFPPAFNLSKSKYVQTMSSSVEAETQSVIFTEGGLDEHVPSSFLSNRQDTLCIEVGKRVLIDRTIRTLNEYGYSENIEAKNIGEYARRGCIVDVFPTNTKNPIRIELDGDFVSSIRYYNPTSQLSIKTIPKVSIPVIIKNLSQVLSITYKQLFDQLGYSTVTAKRVVGGWKLSFLGDGKEPPVKSVRITKITTKTNEFIRKHEQDLSSIFMLGFEKIKTNNFPKGCVYLGGNIKSNIYIKNHGIAIFKNNKIKIENKLNRNKKDEYIFSYNWGDYITHIDYGVGIYRGIVKKRNKDYIKLEYANNSTVLLLAQRIDLIAPLVGTKKQKINNIGGNSWSAQKIKAEKNIIKIIEDMVEINKNMQLRRETPYKKEDYLEKELLDSFPYNETGDQSAAIQDIYKDMNSPGLMDRLIIGDVGFGKTETALRAAAKAAFSGVFVMIVVPTTILANQHFILFKNRLEKFGVTINMLSRFTTQKKQKIIIENIVNNRVDILIGTHKILGDSIPKTRLGLLIIDDEHRFGVAQKNKLLKIKKAVDVLTLTATPIPRTLQQSLLGLKTVSLINTPPVKRVPIKTQVIYQSWKHIKKIMDIELARGGQIYFLHNRIESMPFYKKKIEELFPNINITSAHGEMKSKSLENIILSFYEGKIRILLTTTIIEAGLDIPNANTIIITAAQMYGLSQLYQIRGRVGRGDRQGFCYLVIPKEEGLTDSAIERLKTIQENTDLGSGHNISIKDLEIRGAGNVFGYEQSGSVSSVGYHLYCKMFNDELKRSRGGEKNTRPPKIQYFGNASFHDAYVPLPQDRLYYYQRLSAAKNNQDLGVIKEEVLDRYGAPGPGTLNLYKITLIRILYTQTIVKKILIEKDRVLLTLKEDKHNTDTESRVVNLINALEGSGLKYVFKQLKHDFVGLEIFWGADNDPLTALVRNVELFYYNNNNT